jgi:hypothetical protein
MTGDRKLWIQTDPLPSFAWLLDRCALGVWRAQEVNAGYPRQVPSDDAMNSEAMQSIFSLAARRQEV